LSFSRLFQLFRTICSSPEATGAPRHRYLSTAKQNVVASAAVLSQNAIMRNRTIQPETKSSHLSRALREGLLFVVVSNVKAGDCIAA
jgi:hypothetical protein